MIGGESFHFFRIKKRMITTRAIARQARLLRTRFTDVVSVFVCPSVCLSYKPSHILSVTNNSPQLLFRTCNGTLFHVLTSIEM